MSKAGSKPRLEVNEVKSKGVRSSFFSKNVGKSIDF